MADAQETPNALESNGNEFIDSSILEQVIESGFDQVTISLDQLVSTQNGQLNFTQVQTIVDENAKILSETIKDAAETRWTEAILLLILGAIIAAITAFVFNWLNWRIINKNDNRSVLGRTLVDLVDRFENISIEYWMQPYKAGNDPALSCMEATIKSTLTSIRSSSKIFESKLPTKFQKEIGVKFKAFEEQSFDVATGDNFASKDRVASKENATKILILCNSIRTSILYEIHR